MIIIEKLIKIIKGKKYVAVVDGETGKKANMGYNKKKAISFVSKEIMGGVKTQEWKVVMEKPKNKIKERAVLYIREKDAPKHRYKKEGHRFVGDNKKIKGKW